jgi:thioredoxin reductase (NADPH)
MFVLLFENGPLAGEEIELRGPTVRIGKGPVNDLVLVDPRASFEHCMLSESANGVILRDLGSEIGTRVNEPHSAPIFQPVHIQVGDRIIIGDTVLKLVQVLADDAPTIAPGVPQKNIDTQEVRAYRKPVIEDAPTIIAPPTRRPSTAVPRPTVQPPAIEQIVYNDMVGSGTVTVDTKFPASTNAVVIDPHPAADDLEDEVAQYGLTARLVFLSGPHERRRVFFQTGPIKIGRAEDNDVVIGDPQVKLHSFSIGSYSQGFRVEPLEDLPRINGVEVPKAGALIGHGQVITVGANEIEFLAPGVDNEVDALETVVVKSPIFAFQGIVRKRTEITIGRDPESNIYLDDALVERHHARITFKMPFFHLEAIDAAPIYVDGARIIELRLKDGEVADIAGHELRFDIQGYRLNVELKPRATQDIDKPKFVEDLDVAAPFQTIVRLPGDWQIPKPEVRKEVVDREKLVWKEPHDVKRNWQLPLMVGSGVALAIVTSLILLFFGGESFLRRPISARHRSAEFSEMMTAKVGTNDACATCHQQFQGPTDAACEKCHEGHRADLRPLHLEVKELAAGECSRCHAEHPRETGVVALISGQCEECHQDRHKKLRGIAAVVQKQEPPKAAGLFGLANIRADLAFGDARTVSLHRKHGSISRGCAACHAGGTGERSAPWGSCFVCHGPAEALDSKQCATCHREHGAEWAAAPSEPLIPASAAGAALATVVLLLFPMGLIFFGHATFRRRAKWEETAEPKKAEASPEIEPLKCDGVDTAKAKRLPRLLMSKCTSSGDCVEACPYQVLEMVDKHPVVKSPELCHECGTCVEICGPGALMMWEPERPLPMLPRPAIDPNYQTGVKGGDHGVYIIGEAAGKPLVKNGINVGFFTVHHMIHEGLKPGDAEKNGVDYEIVIAGSGPSGISAAMTARQENFKYVVLEKRETFAATIYDYPKKKRLMESPPPPTPDYPHGVRLMGPLWVSNTTREEAISRWSTEVAKLEIKYGEFVADIEPKGEGFVVRTKAGHTFSCMRVVLAPGTRGDPRTLGKPGDDLPKVRYRLVDAEEHNGHKIMIVGGGDSALEAAIQLAEVHGGSNEVCIVYRRSSFARGKQGNREKIAELIKAGRIKVHFNSNPERIEEKKVVLDTNNLEIENDFVYCMLGGNAPTKWLESLGIKMVQKSIDWEPPPSDQPAFLQFSGTDPAPRTRDK